MQDTTAEVRRFQSAVHRSMGGERRLEIALDLSEAVRELSDHGLAGQFLSRRTEVDAGHCHCNRAWRKSLERLLGQFPSDAYYLSKDAVISALRLRGQFNVIDMRTGWKVDFIIRKDRPFSRVEFGRRQTDELLGVLNPSAAKRRVEGADQGADPVATLKAVYTANVVAW